MAACSSGACATRKSAADSTERLAASLDAASSDSSVSMCQRLDGANLSATAATLMQRSGLASPSATDCAQISVDAKGGKRDVREEGERSAGQARSDGGMVDTMARAGSLQSGGSRSRRVLTHEVVEQLLGQRLDIFGVDERIDEVERTAPDRDVRIAQTLDDDGAVTLHRRHVMRDDARQRLERDVLLVRVLRGEELACTHMERAWHTKNSE